MGYHFCSVVPPHILNKIVQNGSEEQRKHAVKMLAVSSRLRGRRDIIGPMLAHLQVAHGELHRTVYTANSQETLPGSLMRTEGGEAIGDTNANEAYDGAGAVYAMLAEVFQRNSIDNRGMRLDSTVHYGNGYDNAFWDGRQMVYGDGDGKMFNRFTCSIDVIAHEHFHGVTQYECNLDYYGESGAINESISDIFGTVAKQYKLKQHFRDCDWLIGAGLFTDKVHGKALRSMKSPGEAYNDPVIGKDPQPAKMADFVHTEDDEGGVHINSGISNRWFYLLCEILAESPGSGDNETQSWKTPGKIAYETLHHLRHISSFRNFSALTSAAAKQLFGARSKEQTAVKKAWQAVGLTIK